MNNILKIQTEIGTLSKDKKNPFFKSSYFDVNQILEQLLPLLEKHGVTVVQPLTNVDGVPAIKTIVFADGKEVINETIVLPVNNDAQKMGSAITYYRRYALQSLFLLQAEDDDGNKAKPKAKDTLTEKHANWGKVVEYMATASADIKNVTDKYNVSDELIKKLTK